MRRTIPVLFTFLSFVFILVGISWISRSVWVTSRPPLGALPGSFVFRIEMMDSDIFYAGCAPSRLASRFCCLKERKVPSEPLQARRCLVVQVLV